MSRRRRFGERGPRGCDPSSRLGSPGRLSSRPPSCRRAVLATGSDLFFATALALALTIALAACADRDLRPAPAFDSGCEERPGVVCGEVVEPGVDPADLDVGRS